MANTVSKSKAEIWLKAASLTSLICFLSLLFWVILEQKNATIEFLKLQMEIEKRDETIVALKEHITEKKKLYPIESPETHSGQSIYTDRKISFLNPSIPLQAVDSVFKYTIRINHPRSDMAYYTGTKIGGMYWPKDRIPLDGTGEYSGSVTEKGKPPKGVFSLVILQVPERKDIELQAWIREGHKTGNYPGLLLDDFDIGSIILELKTN